MKRAVLVFTYLLLIFSSRAQVNYAVSAIPKTLLPRAGAIVRNSETSIEVKALDDVISKHKVAITVLNSSGANEANIDLYYDKVTQIKLAKGIIYNEFGLPVSKFTEKNFNDRSAVSSMSIYDDDRVKFFHPTQTSYPYTIEYEYEIRSKQSLYFRDWLPVTTTGVSIEKSSLSFICPLNFKLRHKEFNYTGKVQELSDKDSRTFKWQVSNISPLRYEPYSPDHEQFLVSVKLAPETFAFKNIKGSFRNWDEYGRWMYENILKGRDELPEQTRSLVLDMVKDLQNPKEKARKIYEYMQSKTRYISIQIGIGGYLPYPAAEVDRLGYGDCKGLVNYTQALLKVAGIESYYAVVEAGGLKKDLLTDFTSMNQGNHVILCLPFKNDTTWLECTSKIKPFGFLGDFTDDRQVVVCSAEGGKLMRTPKLETAGNRQIRRAEFQVSDKGDLTGSIVTNFEGSQYDNHDVLYNEAYAEQLKKLPDLYPLPNLKIQSFQYKKVKEARPVTTESLSINSTDYCSFNAGKLHLVVNSLNKYTNVPKEVRSRVNPVFINRGWHDEDEITYQLPDSYKLNFPPEKKRIEKPFGSYTTDITFSGNKITYKRIMQLNEGTYAPEEYQQLVDFFQTVYEADHAKLIVESAK
ncbi:DUF3857 domain-containing protein [Desertivirga xinjiangensis]|uniref:DUF3857 domain-containing protein n=1 Tax=Desertivirga xinjiangensis TaxID=539206 RepID=UPI00210A97E9|nr:DUF3857 domain-containing protein [Pedobacter xinjiangensis]